MLCWICGTRTRSESKGPPGVRCSSTKASVAITSRVGRAPSSRRKRKRSTLLPLVVQQVHVLREIAVLDIAGPAAHVGLDEMAGGVIVERNAGHVRVEQGLGLCQLLVASRGVGFVAGRVQPGVVAWIGIAAVVVAEARLEQLQESERVRIIADPGKVEQAQLLEVPLVQLHPEF